MKANLASASLLFLGILIADAAVVYSDNFNRAGLGGGTYTYTTAVTAGDGAASVTGSAILQLSNDGSVAANANGIVYVTTPVSGFGSPYTATLNANPGTVTWSLNMQQIRPNPAAIASGAYGVGFVLAASSSTLTTGNGYAIVMGNSSTPDPVRLVRFTGGINGTVTTMITATSPLNDPTTSYLSLQVSYNPTGDSWSLSGRNDGSTSFTDPTTGTLSAFGSVSDATYTGTGLGSLGVVWSYANGASQFAQFDNFSVSVVPEPTTWAIIAFGAIFGAVQLVRFYRRHLAAA